MVELHKWVVLLLTKDKRVRKTVKETLDEPNNEVVIVSTLSDMFESLSEKDVDLIIFDPNVSALKALDAFSLVKTYHSNVSTVLLYNAEDFEVMSSILEKGFVYRTTKPLDTRYLREIYDGICRENNHWPDRG